MSDSLLTDMGKRIAARRKELRLTQETVAERMGLSLQSVSCFELGKKAIRPENLVNLCRVLEVSPNYLLTGTREPETLTALERELSQLPKDEYALVESLVHCLYRKTTESPR